MKILPFSRKNRGFTLIELLVVIGILAVLLAITLVAINPAKQFSQANDTQRQSDVNAILNAINQYMADNNGAPPAGITTTAAVIGLEDAGTPAAEADLCSILVPEYLAALPVDPTEGTNGVDTGEPVVAGATGTGDCTDAYNTAYTVVQDASDRITVTAPEAEIATSISVTR